jgi:hypothetical protein
VVRRFDRDKFSLPAVGRFGREVGRSGTVGTVRKPMEKWADGWRDAIRIKDSGDALGLRLDGDHAITWEYAGALAEVVQELLLLPQPGSRLAPRLARGRGPSIG